MFRSEMRRPPSWIPKRIRYQPTYSIAAAWVALRARRAAAIGNSSRVAGARRRVASEKCRACQGTS